MKSYERQAIFLAVCLSGFAGFVDSIGFLELGGFFVAFMSGNSTRAGVAIAQHSPDALLILRLILSFVGGVTTGSLLNRAAVVYKGAAVLTLVAGALALAACLGGYGSRYGAAMLMAFAMGAENAVFERGGEVRIGLTYMTGTLVKLGQQIAVALTGGNRWQWFPFLLLWAGMIGGVIIGAKFYRHFGLDSLWLAAAGALGFALIAAIWPRLIEPRAR